MWAHPCLMKEQFEYFSLRQKKEFTETDAKKNFELAAGPFEKGHCGHFENRKAKIAS